MSVIPTDAQPCNEKLLSDLLNENTSDILPQSRNEAFLLGLINKVVPDITPVSRVECYLKALCEKNAAITPDDTTVDGKPWTSKKIVDSLCQPFEESGNPVQVYPVENYPLGVKVSWEPMQKGSGDPSPDNIRPITGRDAVSMVRTGKNLFDQNDTTYLTKDARAYAESDDRALAQINMLPAGTYTLSFAEKIVSLNGIEPIKTRFGLYLRATSGGHTFNVDAQLDISNPTVGQIITNSVTFTLTDEYVGKFQYFYVYTGKNSSFPAPNLYTANIYDVQIELGSTATPYEPYTGDTYTAELPETIYGGELDWNTGVLTVVDKILTITGNEEWNLDDDDNDRRRYSYVIVRLNATADFSDKVATHFTSNGVAGIGNGFEYGKYYMSSYQLVIFDKNRHFESLEQFKAYLSAQYAAGTPVQVCYKLNTPYTIQLTPHQTTALSGVNTIYTDADGVVVTGAEDPKHTITELKNAIISLGGNV